MRLSPIAIARAGLLSALSALPIVGGDSSVVSAQQADRAAPPAPPPRSFGPHVGQVGVETNLVTAAANEHGSYLWIVDPIQHTVTLCEQADPAHDFKCEKKPLP
jgi:hypothetical protein